jgi:hypothetical protein
MNQQEKKPINPTIKEGMTLRDYFANSAMQGLISNPNIVRPRNNEPEKLQAFCTVAFEYADAMLKAREL